MDIYRAAKRRGKYPSLSPTLSLLEMDGAEVRAFASHQCGLGPTTYFGLVSYVLFSRLPGFSLSIKSNTTNSTWIGDPRNVASSLSIVILFQIKLRIRIARECLQPSSCHDPVGDQVIPLS